jgi:redox-sensing transcriptional repressor
MIDAGIRGILNFAPVELKCTRTDCPESVAIHNVNIALELEHLFYQVNTMEHEEEENTETPKEDSNQTDSGETEN